ncbi:hypothetical protein MES5069_20075 [Mesorhizobium escarrei]|uniref:Uncharacterized protein n=1 Tax=Mesorhizobium escarrei TaxID=666018 RepID=A0ABN8JLV7_9HYPH|nr:hypothetical protein MES5069_20075 [Mesorhizobium escarrei]
MLVSAETRRDRVLIHVAQKHAFGPDPRVCSGFAITTCIKQQPNARRMTPVKRDAL